MSKFKVKYIEDKIATGHFSVTDTPNRNGFTIPKDVMKKAVTEYLCSSIPHIGYLNRDYSQTQIDISKASHIVTDMFYNDDTFSVTIKALDTPTGRILSTMMESGIDLEFNGYYNARPDDDKVVFDMSIKSIDILIPKE